MISMSGLSSLCALVLVSKGLCIDSRNTDQQRCNQLISLVKQCAQFFLLEGYAEFQRLNKMLGNTSKTENNKRAV